VRVVQMLPLRRFDYFDPQTVAHVQPVSMFLAALRARARRPAGCR
jgi:hypothetical protein